MGMNAETIKRALRMVHEIESTSINHGGMPRHKAVEHVLKTGPALSTNEVEVLLNALHVRRDELTHDVSE